MGKRTNPMTMPSNMERVSGPHEELDRGPYSAKVYRYNEPGPKKHWGYSQVEVRKNGEIVGTATRSYTTFPMEIAVNHRDTKEDYLFYGPHYSLFGVMNLKTGEKVESEEPFGWCWGAYTISPSGKYMAVEGCVWGGPWHTWVIELPKDPMKNIEGWPKKILYRSENMTTDVKWRSGDKLEFLFEYEYCHLFNKPSWQLTDEEEEIAEKTWDEKGYDAAYEWREKVQGGWNPKEGGQKWRTVTF